jgi:hypothetical protein
MEADDGFQNPNRVSRGVRERAPSIKSGRRIGFSKALFWLTPGWQEGVFVCSGQGFKVFLELLPDAVGVLTAVWMAGCGLGAAGTAVGFVALLSERSYPCTV